MLLEVRNWQGQEQNICWNTHICITTERGSRILFRPLETCGDTMVAIEMHIDGLWGSASAATLLPAQ